MFGFSRQKLLALGVFLLLASGVGCAGSNAGHGAFDWWPFQSSSDEVPGVKTPDQRMQELKELTKKGSTSDAAEQQRVSVELAKEIQFERDPALRKQILRTLAVYPTPVASAVLVGGLADNDADVRSVCCEAWGRRGGPEAVQQLAKAMSSDTSVDVRLAAAKALGQTKAPAAVGPLAEALVDGDPAMQHRAMESLKMVSGRDYGGDINAWREFAKNGNAQAPEPSLVERLKRLF